MKIVNLTPHAVTVHRNDGTTITFPPDGTIARVGMRRQVAGYVDGVTLYKLTTGDVAGLPAYVDGTLFIVSAMVRNAVPLRLDVVSPGELTRDEKGIVTGCLGLDGNL